MSGSLDGSSQCFSKSLFSINLLILSSASYLPMESDAWELATVLPEGRSKGLGSVGIHISSALTMQDGP